MKVKDVKVEYERFEDLKVKCEWTVDCQEYVKDFH